MDARLEQISSQFETLVIYPSRHPGGDEPEERLTKTSLVEKKRVSLRYQHAACAL